MRKHLRHDRLAVHQRGVIGETPLHWAAEHEPQVVQLLLACGAEVDSRNTMDNAMHGFTPLIMCAMQHDDCAECAQLLLDAGAGIDATDAAGKTPLAWAVARSSNRVEKVLRDRRANQA